MAGIYIHIPYCRKACHYCNFHFSTSLGSIDEMIKALQKEIILQKDFLREPVETIYFGGGTPSILEPDKIALLIKAVQSTFGVKAGAEITLEANPDDISKDTMRALQEIGINRMSLGVQSFDDKVLTRLNRSHNSQQAFKAIENIRLAEIENITIDLIYGIPGQSDRKWRTNLVEAVQLDIQHLSAYALTIEEKTVFGNWYSKDKIAPVNDDGYASQYEYMCSFLKDSGFTHYEISNFAKPGFESRHNQSYWEQKHYLGIGPGAHSYNGKTRFFNVSNNPYYIRSMKEGQIPFEKEHLSTEDRINEYLMTGLRTKSGISLNKLSSEFNYDLMALKGDCLHRYIDEDLMTDTGEHLVLTDKGLFLSDAIIVELMIEEHESRS